MNDGNKGWAVVLRSGGFIRGGREPRITKQRYLSCRSKYLKYCRGVRERIRKGELLQDDQAVHKVKCVLLSELVDMRTIIYRRGKLWDA